MAHKEKDSHCTGTIDHKRTNVAWVTSIYNDEATLLALRSAHPQVPWRVIRDMLNDHVPKERKRSLQAVYSKAKVICQDESSTAPALQSQDTISDHVITTSKALAHILTHSKATIVPPLSSHTHMEILNSCWDGFLDPEGYSGLIAEEMQALDMTFDDGYANKAA